MSKEELLVESARRTSLLVLAVAVLSFFQVGRLHSNRVLLLSEVQVVAAIQWVRNQAKGVSESECRDAFTEEMIREDRESGLRFSYFSDRGRDQWVDPLGGHILMPVEDNQRPPVPVSEIEYDVSGWGRIDDEDNLEEYRFWIKTLRDPETSKHHVFAGPGKTTVENCKDFPPPSSTPASVGVRLFDFADKTAFGQCHEKRFTRIVFEIASSDGGLNPRWVADIFEEDINPDASVEFVCKGERQDRAKITVYRYKDKYSNRPGPLIAQVSTVGEGRSWITGPFDWFDESVDRRLVELMLAYGVEGDPKDEDNLTKLVSRASRDLYGRKLSVGVSGASLALSSEEAIWILAWTTLALLVGLRSRLHAIEQSESLGKGAPWLMLDGSVGLEGFVARAWLFGLLLGPASVLFSLTLTAADGVAARGEDVTSSAFTLGLMLLATALVGWAAVTAWLAGCRIWHLRFTGRSYAPRADSLESNDSPTTIDGQRVPIDGISRANANTDQVVSPSGHDSGDHPSPDSEGTPARKHTSSDG